MRPSLDATGSAPPAQVFCLTAWRPGAYSVTEAPRLFTEPDEDFQLPGGLGRGARFNVFALRQKPLGGNVLGGKSWGVLCFHRGSKRSKVLTCADKGTTVGLLTHNKRFFLTHTLMYTCTPYPLPS